MFQNLFFKKKQKAVFVVLTILIISMIFISLFSDDKKKNLDESTSKTFTQTVLIEKINLIPYKQKVILRGFTNASRTVILKAQVEGKISVINDKKGLKVKAGDRIVLIDPEDKIAKSKEMEALLDQRKKEYEVAEKLFKNGFRSEVKLSEARTNFEKALALFEKSQVALNNTKVIIPFDSFLEESYVELGDYLKKGDQIVKIVDLDPIYLEVTATENEMKDLHIGKTGDTLLGNGIDIKGRINFISSTANEVTRNFNIQIEIPNPRKTILSGISGEVIFYLNPVDAFLIPSSVITLNKSGDLGIKIIENKVVKFKKIQILSDTGEGYWVKNFTSAKKIDLITRGQEYVIDGELVNIEYLN